MGKRQVDKTSAAYKKYRRRKVLFIIEVFLLILVGAGVYAYLQVDRSLDKIQVETLDTDKIIINEAAETDVVIKGYTNIAIFGADSRDANVEKTNTDTIIIASINNDTKVVRLVSVYRDTYLNINGDRYQKANAAYANGGVEWAISMLNTNLDLNIKDYVTVDFNAVSDIVDILDGIQMTLTDAEAHHLNNYCVETSKVTGKGYDTLPGGGTYTLNGVQAVAFCRIRQTAGNDFKRTERQRQVIAKIVEKVKANPTKLPAIADQVFSMVKTNMGKDQILKMGMNMLSYKLGETTGFPFTHRTSASGDNEVPITLESNVDLLHTFLFDNEEYTPSADVISRSRTIIEKTGYDENTAASDENFQTSGEGGSAEKQTESE